MKVHSGPTVPRRDHGRRRRSERGQALVLAVAFLGMFGLFAASVLGFATTVQQQRSATEKTATVDAVAEGSAQFAVSDTTTNGCGSRSGTLAFPANAAMGQTTTGDLLKYSSSACRFGGIGG